MNNVRYQQIIFFIQASFHIKNEYSAYDELE